jgi:hypothetical protein
MATAQYVCNCLKLAHIYRKKYVQSFSIPIKLTEFKDPDLKFPLTSRIQITHNINTGNTSIAANGIYYGFHSFFPQKYQRRNCNDPKLIERFSEYGYKERKKYRKKYPEKEKRIRQTYVNKTYKERNFSFIVDQIENYALVNVVYIRYNIKTDNVILGYRLRWKKKCVG